MFAGLGKNDQKVYVVPSQGLVVVRMGNDAGGSLFAKSSFDDQLWRRLSELECATGSLKDRVPGTIKVYPQPAYQILNVEIGGNHKFDGRILDMNGRVVIRFNEKELNVSSLAPGTYVLRCETEKQIFHQRIHITK